MSRQQKRQGQREYSEKDREFKRMLEKDKRTHLKQWARDAEEAAEKGNIKAVYNVTRKLIGHTRTTDYPIGNTGSLLT